MKKRLIAIFIVVTFLAGSMMPAFAITEYPNVSQGDPSSWAKEEVYWAIELGMIPTTLQNNYQGAINRAQTAELICATIEHATNRSIDWILEYKGVTIDQNAFTDTKSKYVLAANALGIIKGVGNKKFNPNATLTRAQAAAIANRMGDLFPNSSKKQGVRYEHHFKDVSKHWVNSELGWPVSAGIIKGVSKDKFAPDKILTVEQAIIIANRTMREI